MLGLLIILCFALTTQANEMYGPIPLPEPSVQPIHSIHTQDALNFEKLRSFIDENKITSVASLIANISEFKPMWHDILQSTVMVYASEGDFQSQVNWKNPLAIIHKDNLFLEFPTNGTEQINVMEYLPEEKLFSFHQIRFKSNKVHFQINSKDCAQCHGVGENARPIWGSHKLWAGAYGGLGDRMPSISQERIRYIEMSKKQNARLSLLQVPGFDRASVVSTAKTNGIVFLHRPNQGLNDHIHQLNQYRVFDFLMKRTQYEKYRFAYAGALLNCSQVGTPNGFMPESYYKSHEARLRMTYSELSADTLKEIGIQFHQRASTYNALAKVNFELEPTYAHPDAHFSSDLRVAPILTKLRFLIEGQAKNFRYLAPIPKLGHASYTFADSKGGIRDLLPLMRQEDSELRELTGDSSEKSCTELAKRSLKSFSQSPAIGRGQKRRKPDMSPSYGSTSVGK